MALVQVTRGAGPVVLALPHTGTHIPEPIWDRLSPRGREKADTDWHVERLYDGLLDGVTTVRTTVHRYAVDANRDPTGATLYPGLNTTGLVPLTDFDGQDIWQMPPTDAEVLEWRDAYHAPYHTALMAELERVRSAHGVAILYDCHSIRSHIPFLFDGTLPDFNIGTNGGTTCAPLMAHAVAEICARADGYTTVTDGRFKGGWTTRHYGRPDEGLHAIQMELAQSTYLAAEAPPWEYDTALADRLREHLSTILTTLAELAPMLGGTR